MLKSPDLTLAEAFEEAASDPFLQQVKDLARSNPATEESAGPGWDLRVARRAHAATNLVKEAVFDKVVAHLGNNGVEVVAPYKGMRCSGRIAYASGAVLAALRGHAGLSRWARAAARARGAGAIPSSD